MAERQQEAPPSLFPYLEDGPRRVARDTPADENPFGHSRGRAEEGPLLQPQRRWSRKPASGFGGSSAGRSAAAHLDASLLWDAGYAGRGVRVGIFDTGLAADHPHFEHVAERTDWTGEGTAADGLGHGSFVAGVIASVAEECPGIAPEAELHIFRVFTSKQVSFTSWFLDAFNYAIHKKMTVVNLSIGGPDYRDQPFVDKVNELTANGIIMVSAIGNDGPLFGTLNNPGDQNNVIGVGGMDFDLKLAPFSSRGMTTWELPLGYGRFKPDLVTFGSNVLGSRTAGGCRALSGTSVASPVATGAVALLASVVPEDRREQLVNPASMKQALVHTAVRLPHDERSVFEQGQGMLNLSAAAIYLDTYTPRVTILPPRLDTTDCPYMWPYCRQPLYYSAQPLLANFTILNGLGAVGHVTGPVTWHPASPGVDLIDVAAEPSALLWPWAGSLGVRVAVRREARYASAIAAGELRLTVISPPSPQEINQGPQPAPPRRAQVVLPIRVHIEPTPPRARRLLWDQFHSLAYPPGYLPRDDLGQRADPLDWNGDHPHTNFRSVFHHLRNAGYFVEILSEPWTCFDPHLYGALLLVDPEEEIFAREATQLRRAVAETGLNLLIVADWYSEAVLDGVRFFDDNTRNWWFPETGGANVPALNGLLAPWGMAFGGDVLDGRFTFQDSIVPFHSGTSLAAFPVGGYLVSAMLNNQALQMETSSKRQGDEHKDKASGAATGVGGPRTLRAPIIGLYAVPPEPESNNPQGEVDSPRHRGPGRVVLYGDSSCLDDSHATDTQRCLGLLDAFLGYLGGQDEDLPASALLDVAQRLSYPLPIPAEGLPDRSPKSTLHLYSRVLESTGRGGAERELPLCGSTVWASQRAPGLAASQPVVAAQTADEGLQNLKKKLAPPPPGQARTVAPNRFVPRPEKGRSFFGVIYAKMATPGGMIFLVGFSIVVFSQMRGRRGRSRTRVMQFAGSAGGGGGRGGRGEQGESAGHLATGLEDAAARV